MIRIRLAELIAKRSFEEGRRLELAEVAQDTGIHRSTLSKILHIRGYNITASNLDRLCAYFVCEVQDVLTYVPDEQLANGVSLSFKGPMARKAKAAGARVPNTRSSDAKSAKSQRKKVSAKKAS